jgi:hypothetical protein
MMYNLNLAKLTGKNCDRQPSDLSINHGIIVIRIFILK